jgi:hypothetical protein
VIAAARQEAIQPVTLLFSTGDRNDIFSHGFDLDALGVASIGLLINSGGCKLGAK